MRGKVYKAKGDREQANSDFAIAVEKYTTDIGRYSEDDEAFAGRGDAFREMGDFNRAIGDYTKAIEFRAQRFSEVYRARGQALEDKEEIDAALADYSKAIEFDLGDLVGLTGRARLLERKKDQGGLLNDCRRIVDILRAPKSSEQFRLRAWARLKMEDVRGALPDAERAVEMQPGSGGRPRYAWSRL